jgi:hypothetical protein
MEADSNSISLQAKKTLLGLCLATLCPFASIAGILTAFVAEYTTNDKHFATPTKHLLNTCK